MSINSYICPKGQVKDGFFIEAGADEFEEDSNTLYFEENPQHSFLLFLIYCLFVLQILTEIMVYHNFISKIY